MTRFLSLAAAGLILAGIAAAPVEARHWGGGYGGYGGYGGGYGGYGGGHGGGWRHGGWGRPHWGHRCRTVVISRFSHWRGHVVQRPVQMCG